MMWVIFLCSGMVFGIAALVLAWIPGTPGTSHIGECPNRTHSGYYGLKVYLCNVHHLAGTGPEAVHANKKIMAMLHEEGQRAVEDRFGSREEFMKIFGKNFIMEDHKHDGH